MPTTKRYSHCLPKLTLLGIQDQKCESFQRDQLVEIQNIAGRVINIHRAYLAPHVLKSYLLCMVYMVSPTNTVVVMTKAFKTKSTSKYVTRIPSDRPSRIV